MILITGRNGFIGKRISYGRAFEGDITNHKSILEQTGDVEGIIHLAAKSNKRICAADPIGCISVNLISLCKILEVAIMRDIWVIFISTFQSSEKSLYGLSKLTGEELCRIYKQKGAKVEIVRLPIVYGPGDKPDKIVTKLISRIKSGKEISIDSNDDFYFAYADDIAKLIENEVKVMNGQVGEKCSFRTVIDGIRECLKKGEYDD